MLSTNGRPLRSALIVFISTVALLGSRTARAGINRWTSGGPWAGGVTSIAADPSNPQTVYAASQYAGIFRSRDGGVSWQPVNRGLLDLWITGLAIDPSTPMTLYASSYNYFVYKSTDAGDHWVSQYINDPMSAYGLVHSIAIDPVVPSTLYAATGAGVWKTTDGGCSWSASIAGLPFGGTDAFSVTVDPIDDAIVYLGTFQHGIYRSADAGATWTLALASNAGERAQRIAVDPANDSVVYAATDYFYEPTGEQGGWLYRSGDRGLTWSPIASLPNEPFVSVAIDSSDPSIYVGSRIGGVRRSPDGGATWSSVNEGLPGMSANDLSIGAAPDLVWVASGGAAVFKSTDAAVHWTDATTGIAGLLYGWIVIDPADNSTLWCTNGWGDGAGVFRSTDEGQSWTRKASGLAGFNAGPLAAMPGPPLTLFAGSSAGVFRSSDLGDTWVPAAALPPGTTPEVSGLTVPATDPSRIYAAAGPLLYSDDAGDSWTPASAELHQVYALAPDAEVAGSSLAWVDGIVQRSTDSGATWTPSDTGMETATVQVIVQDPATPDHVLAGVAGDSIAMIAPLFVSSDRGATWSPSADGLPPSYSVTSIVFDPASPATVYACGYGVSARAVYRSVDGGATWAPDDPGLPLRSDFSHLAVSSDGTVHMAGLGGVFELRQSPTPPPTVAAVEPSSGDAAGGTLVLVTGSGLASITSVQFGKVAAESFLVVDDSHVAAIVPAGAPGAISVTVATGQPQIDTLERAFVNDFADLPAGSQFHDAVVALTLRAVTGGCGGGNFCPAAPLNRGQAAVQIEKALHGADYPFEPPFAGPGLSMADVDRCSGFGPYIQQFLLDGVTAGCGYPNYCPLSPVTRAQMMVFLLRTEHGSSYVPPPATGTVFNDVPVDSFAADYIEAAAQEGITAGCGGGNFCPGSPVTRGQAAALIQKTLPTTP